MGLSPRGAPEQAVHRPTELALGHAATVLYRALSDPQRRDLGELPNTIERLAEQAARMRQRVEELDDLLDAAEASRENGQTDGRATDLRQAKEVWQQRLSKTVASLETIRLGLLRLHSGSEGVASVTTDLDLAREMAEHLERLLQARSEVEESLRNPSTPQSVIPPASSAAPPAPSSDRPSRRSAS